MTFNVRYFLMLRFVTACILILLTSVQKSYPQNLVINPGFEDYDTCVVNVASFRYPYINDWNDPTAASTDYFNTCSINPNVVPQTSYLGGINPRNGEGIAGCVFHSNPSANLINGEYVQGKLSNILEKDSFYCIKFYLALASEGKLSIDRIGVKFSDELYNFNSTAIPFAADLESPENRFYDKIGIWDKVQMTYRARGGEEYITIGNFREIGGSTNTRLVGAPFGDWRDETSYYYIDDVSVEKIPAHFANINLGNDSILCDTSGFTKTLSVPDIYDSIHWNTGESTFQITVNTLGKYSATTYIGGCEVRDTIEFSLFSGNVFNPLNDLEYCESDAPIQVTASSGFDSYQWSTGSSSASIEISQSGIYGITASDQCNVYVDSFELLLKPNPLVPETFDTTLCENDRSVYATAAGNNLKWYFSREDSIPLSSAPEITTETPGTQNYFVSQTVNNCESEKAIYTAIINLLPRLDLATDSAYCIGEMARLEAGKESDYNYVWSTGDSTPYIEIRESGTYGSTVSNACGSINESVEIKFVPCENCVYVPNAFTPNGDQVNDVFRAYSPCPLRQFRMQIFNRWGEVVFESQEIGKGWDGNNNGTKSEDGVYVYRISYIYENNEREVRSGSLTLIK